MMVDIPQPILIGHHAAKHIYRFWRAVSHLHCNIFFDWWHVATPLFIRLQANTYSNWWIFLHLLSDTHKVIFYSFSRLRTINNNLPIILLCILYYWVRCELTYTCIYFMNSVICFGKLGETSPYMALAYLNLSLNVQYCSIAWDRNLNVWRASYL